MLFKSQRQCAHYLVRTFIVAAAAASLSAYAGSDKISGGGTNVSGKTSYAYYVTGDANRTPDIRQRPRSPSTVLMGGDNDVDEAFRWMITRAGVTSSSGGRFVIIRATSSDGYNCYVYYSNYPTCSTTGAAQSGSVGGAALGLSSVETLVIPSATAANDAKVNEIVGRADVIWIAGGDQADYYKNWRGTALEQTLSQAISRNVPVGGTSAGMMVLPRFDFAALRGSVTSAQALADPFNKYMSIESESGAQPAFIVAPGLDAAIVDAHVDERDRMGRLMTFMARLIRQEGATGCAGGVLSGSAGASNGARAIGLAIQTALLIEGPAGSQTARRVSNAGVPGSGAAYLLQPSMAPETCLSGKPLTMRGISVRKITDSQSFNFSNWSTLPYREANVVNGTLSNFAY
ncbi:cyanophycinase [Noviherbaspirillum aerium]|uniref:cyanophycinase n=1 Tax=Noviherbaspirillum aerium TaxID=2588497 RepID=UPI00178C55A6|nr:cyanophycinase [Noviherbaspirillum aerium]